VNKREMYSLLLGSVTGFAAFDPDEKNRGLESAICAIVIKDAMGEVVARVPSHFVCAIGVLTISAYLPLKLRDWSCTICERKAKFGKEKGKSLGSSV